ncbi:hypothetical protein IGI04_003213 [Brassica rapa subsp. trilocularis]|uniref:Uncharacterized protein n=1 Tax=Brassica rapa subsp. trilocularis TaxID=1813537 RepID=A0ABQ7NYG9_BRACM|nr:hypothetical protein IGI04_003213 [Brassica rapa subsp. trilocularis]
MGGKGQLLAAGSNKTAHHLAPLSLALCFVKPSPESWRFGVLKLTITHVLQPLILIDGQGLCSDQPDPCGDFKSRIFQKPSVISLSSSIVFLSQSHGFKSDRKYSENLRSTIEEHRPCHFRSSTIGGVTKVKHRDKLERIDLTYRCYYHQARVCYPYGRVHYRPVRSQVDTLNTSPDSCVINVKLMLRHDGSTGSILFSMRHHEAYDAKKKKMGSQDTEEGLNRSRHTLFEADLGFNTQSRILTWSFFRELQEGFGSKLFEYECYELLVESQELLQRVEFELDRFHELKK